MQIILLERIEKLGMMGQVVQVKPGYARNFLLPQKKALRATRENLDFFENQKKDLEAQNLKAREDAEFVAKRLEGVAILLVRQAGETGQLYGSISSRDIAEGIHGLVQVVVSKSQVFIHAPIKALGVHTVDVALHPEVRIPVQVSVAQSEDEARKNLTQKNTVRAGSSRKAEKKVEETEAKTDEAEANDVETV